MVELFFSLVLCHPKLILSSNTMKLIVLHAYNLAIYLSCRMFKGRLVSWTTNMYLDRLDFLEKFLPQFPLILKISGGKLKNQKQNYKQPKNRTKKNHQELYGNSGTFPLIQPIPSNSSLCQVVPAY